MIIIAVSAMFAVIAFATILILNPFGGSFDLSGINQYDCAKTFDSLMLDTIAFDTDGIMQRSGAMNHYQALDEMMQNRCWIIMDSWLDNSNYDSLKNMADFEYQYGLSQKAEQNQLILGELTCKDIQKNPSQYYYGKNFDLENCERGVKILQERQK